MKLKNAYMLTLDCSEWNTARNVLVCLESEVSDYISDNVKAAFEKWKKRNTISEKVMMIDYVSYGDIDVTI